MVDLVFIVMVLLIASLLSVLHILSDIISKFMEKYHYMVLSFSAGTLIAYIFLVMLPEIIHFSTEPFIFLLILLGFTIFHVSEKYLYQHVKNKKEIMTELKELHAAGFFIDHYILGFVLVITFEYSETFGFLILIPIFMHTISSAIAMEHIHQKVKIHINKIVLAISPFLGASTAIILDIHGELQALFLALILGMLLYIVSRDIIPKGEKGYPSYFVI